jgi:hypothetical protein
MIRAWNLMNAGYLELETTNRAADGGLDAILPSRFVVDREFLRDNDSYTSGRDSQGAEFKRKSKSCQEALIEVSSTIRNVP